MLFIVMGLDLRTPRRLHRMRQRESDLARHAAEAQTAAPDTREETPLFLNNLWFWDRSAR